MAQYVFSMKRVNKTVRPQREILKNVNLACALVFLPLDRRFVVAIVFPSPFNQRHDCIRRSPLAPVEPACIYRKNARDGRSQGRRHPA